LAESEKEPKGQHFLLSPECPTLVIKSPAVRRVRYPPPLSLDSPPVAMFGGTLRSNLPKDAAAVDHPGVRDALRFGETIERCR